jgi:hypothetical protein
LRLIPINPRQTRRRLRNTDRPPHQARRLLPTRKRSFAPSSINSRAAPFADTRFARAIPPSSQASRRQARFQTNSMLDPLRPATFEHDLQRINIEHEQSRAEERGRDIGSIITAIYKHKAWFELLADCSHQKNNKFSNDFVLAKMLLDKHDGNIGHARKEFVKIVMERDNITHKTASERFTEVLKDIKKQK